MDAVQEDLSWGSLINRPCRLKETGFYFMIKYYTWLFVIHP
jgi:hypothetical protein